ncbi:MAG: hypothetical protein ACFFDP_00995 [Promethearchaeota archaeon]
MTTLQGSVLTITDTTLQTQLLQLAMTYVKTQQVANDFHHLAKIELDDVFLLLERFANQIDRLEIQRLYELLIELSVVRENPILPKKELHEVQLISAIQKTGRLGEFISLLLAEANK